MSLMIASIRIFLQIHRRHFEDGEPHDADQRRQNQEADAP